MNTTVLSDSAPPGEIPLSRSESRSAIMAQYRAAKEKHPGMLLLFRMGDFYELFEKDAETAHKLLGLTLTMRDRTLAMAGFPHHQLEAYLHKLLHEGQRVAICEPADESMGGAVQREVTRVAPADEVEDQKETRSPAPNKRKAKENTDRPVRQPRHFVIKKCDAWLNEAGVSFVSVDDVGRTTPAVVPHVGALDFIVLRGEEKLLVTVRPHLQAKHLKSFHELRSLFGSEYKTVRIWPVEGSEGWIWREYPIEDMVSA